MLWVDHNKIILLYTPFPSIPIFFGQLVVVMLFCSMLEIKDVALHCIVLYCIVLLYLRCLRGEARVDGCDEFLRCCRQLVTVSPVLLQGKRLSYVFTAFIFMHGKHSLERRPPAKNI